MKIVLVTIDEPFYMPRVVETIAGARSGDVVACVILRPFSPRSGWIRTIRQQWMYLGALGFVRQGVRFVWYKLRQRTVRRVCGRMGIRVLDPANINAAAFLDVPQTLAPDVVVSL